MPDAAALVAALSIMQTPASSRLARRSPLPRGMTFLLEVAAGEGDALAHARSITGKDDEVLRAAAGFFVEQVLLTGGGSHYRVLGAASDADIRDLRRHMSLLLKWLHPDAAPHNGTDQTIDRSVFATRITEAWQTLKSEESRGQYDSILADEFRARSSTRRGRSASSRRSRTRRKPAGLVSRMIDRFWRRDV